MPFWVFLAVHKLSLVMLSRGYSLVVGHRLLIVVASLAVQDGLKGTQPSEVAA